MVRPRTFENTTAIEFKTGATKSGSCLRGDDLSLAQSRITRLWFAKIDDAHPPVKQVNRSAIHISNSWHWRRASITLIATMQETAKIYRAVTAILAQDVVNK